MDGYFVEPDLEPEYLTWRDDEDVVHVEVEDASEDWLYDAYFVDGKLVFREGVPF